TCKGAADTAPGAGAAAGTTTPPGPGVAGAPGGGVACGLGFAVGALTSNSRLAPTKVSVPENIGRRLALVQSGRRTMRGIITISTSLSWLSPLSSEKR